MYNENTDDLIIVDEAIKDEYERKGYVVIYMIG